MSPKKRKQVLGVIDWMGNKATVREIAAHMSLSTSVVGHYILDLRRERAIEVTGERHDTGAVRPVPEYGLCRLVRVAESIDIFEQCRANWQGYRVHKVFGAGGAVRI